MNQKEGKVQRMRGLKKSLGYWTDLRGSQQSVQGAELAALGRKVEDLFMDQ